jgi:hypothetical protein
LNPATYGITVLSIAANRLFARKGWLESRGERYILVVTQRRFAFGDAPRAVLVRNIVIVQRPEPGDDFDKECIARIEGDLGMEVEAFGWVTD